MQRSYRLYTCHHQPVNAYAAERLITSKKASICYNTPLSKDVWAPPNQYGGMRSPGGEASAR